MNTTDFFGINWLWWLKKIDERKWICRWHKPKNEINAGEENVKGEVYDGYS